MLYRAVCHDILYFSARVLANVVPLPLTTPNRGGFQRWPGRECQLQSPVSRRTTRHERTWATTKALRWSSEFWGSSGWP